MSANEGDRPLATTRGLSPRDRDAGECHGTPMRVLLLDPAGGTLARCAGTDGIPATVETALVGMPEPGEVLLVHRGIAFARLDAEWIP